MIPNVIFTPILHPPVPRFDSAALREWISSVYPQRELFLSKADSAALTTLEEDYPWNTAFAKFQSKGWMSEFNAKFPELAAFFQAAFGLEEEELGSVILLPLKDTKRGLGFFHRDTDASGLRIYLEVDHPEDNPLLLIPTKEPYLELSDLGAIVPPEHPSLQDVFLKAKFEPGVSCYYVNNFRCVHAPLITKPGNRLAVLVYPTFGYGRDVMRKTQALIESSAKHFSSSIYWKPEYPEGTPTTELQSLSAQKELT